MHVIHSIDINSKSISYYTNGGPQGTKYSVVKAT